MNQHRREERRCFMASAARKQEQVEQGCNAIRIRERCQGIDQWASEVCRLLFSQV